MGQQFTWTHRATDRYLAIGRLVDGKRFRIESANPYNVLYRNYYDARVYLLRDGKRILVQRSTP